MQHLIAKLYGSFDAFGGGSEILAVEFFSDLSDGTFVTEGVFNTLQIIIGDAFLVREDFCTV